MRRVLAALAAAATLCGSPALADVAYHFSAAPDAGWDPFSFSFTASDILGPGDPFSFSAFTISNGAETFSITHGTSTVLAGQGNCFLFATGGITLNGGDQVQCGVPSTYAAGEAAFWFYSGDEFLPPAEGTYADRYVAVFGAGSSGDQLATGQDFAGVIQIGDAVGGVPEPAAWSLMILGFGMAGALMRRNRFALS